VAERRPSQRVPQPPSSMSGDLGRWAQQVAGALNVMPKLSYTSYATPEGQVDGGTGDVLINLVTDATVPRVWVKQSDAVVNAVWSALAGSGGGMTAVNSVTGTANRVTATPTTGNIVINIASAYDALWGAKYGANDSPTFGTVAASHVSSSGASVSRATVGQITSNTTVTAIAVASPILQSGSSTDLLLKYNSATKVTIGTAGVTFEDWAKAQGFLAQHMAGGGSVAVASNVTGDSYYRFTTGADGQLSWGSGTATLDTFLSRAGVNALSTGTFTCTAGLTATTGTFSSDVSSTKAIYSGTTVTAAQGDIGFPYGTFYSTVSQSITTTVAAQVLTFNAQGPFSRISHSTSGNPSRIGILDAGAYLITFSGIGKETTADKTHLDVWLRKDGSDVTASNTRVELPTKETEAVTAVSFIETFTANQYFEFATHGDSTGLAWLATPSGTTPTRPLCPSLIVTVNKVSK
jgi:hypothetical protein